MFEYRGLVANLTGSSKAKNENAGFATPQNKGVISRKALFTDKPKMALGDLKKNSFNVVTPMKNGTSEKIKQQQQRRPLQLSTPINKPVKIVRDAVILAPEPKRNIIDYTKDEVDVWNQKILLSDSQFDMIFMSPPRMAPPSPTPFTPPSPLSDYDPDVIDCPDFHFDYISNFGRKISSDDKEDELPPIDINW